MLKHNSKKWRTGIALFVVLVVSIGFVVDVGIGTLSAIGWSDITMLCPLGALGTIIASKMLIPQAVVSLAFGVLLMLFVGRAFCAWICPVPLIEGLRGVFKKKEKQSKEVTVSTVLTQEELLSLEKCSSNCSSCKSKRELFDTRHFILGGSLLSSALFGFPVFCLVCPIGLTFASILLVVRLFSGGDVTWSLVLVPLLLVVEVFIFRKWCHKICPLSAFMSLFAKANKTLQPVIDDKKCIETSQGQRCGACGKVCEELINLRHPELGAKAINECTRCRACVDVCPANAITVPLLASKKK